MRLYTFVIAAVCALSLGCGSGTGPSGATGTMRMMLKDSPFVDASSVLVTFSEVDVYKGGTADGVPTKLPFPAGTTRTCDLTRLQAVQDVLGTGPLATGHYTQIRLIVTAAVLYFGAAPTTGDACGASITPPTGGRSANVTIPSGEVKLNREFDITADTTTTMSIDFDGDKSVHETSNGTYTMSPVISVVSVQ